MSTFVHPRAPLATRLAAKRAQLDECAAYLAESGRRRQREWSCELEWRCRQYWQLRQECEQLEQQQAQRERRTTLERSRNDDAFRRLGVVVAAGAGATSDAGDAKISATH